MLYDWPYHAFHIKYMTIVFVKRSVFGDVCKVRQIVRVLTRAIDISDFVLANRVL